MRTSFISRTSSSALLLLSLAGCNLAWGPTTSCPTEPAPCEMECGGQGQGSCDDACPQSCDDGSKPNGSDELNCLDYYNATVTVCAAYGLAPVFSCSQDETGVTDFSASCGLDTDNDGDGDIYIENNVNAEAEAEANANAEGSGSGGDDGDDDTEDTDDTSEEAMRDDRGAQGGVHDYDAALTSWFSANGIPAQLYCNGDVQCDADQDGTLDLWTTVVYVKYPLILDFDDLSIMDISTAWYSTYWGDGTDDATTDDVDIYSEDDGDCDDQSINGPGTTEVCGDGMDNDCDTIIDESCATDEDGDGYSELTGDCNDLASSIAPGVYEYSDGVDNDCDGTTDELNTIDGDGDGVTEVGGDCDDGNTSVFPGATEYCNNADDDCDGTIDEVDSDGDGYTGCSAYDGSTLLPDDCNDSDAAINPGEVEIVNWMDDDCDSTADAECTTVDYDNYYAGSDPEVCDGV